MGKRKIHCRAPRRLDTVGVRHHLGGDSRSGRLDRAGNHRSKKRHRLQWKAPPRNRRHGAKCFPASTAEVVFRIPDCFDALLEGPQDCDPHSHRPSGNTRPAGNGLIPVVRSRRQGSPACHARLQAGTSAGHLEGTGAFSSNMGCRASALVSPRGHQQGARPSHGGLLEAHRFSRYHLR